MATKMQTKPAAAQAVPEDYGSITPYIVVAGADRFLEFLNEAFGAIERGRTYNPDGSIGHAEVWLGDSVVMMFDAQRTWPATPSFLAYYVEDCDSVYQQALKAGAVTVTAPMTSAWGDRGCRIRDPFGNIWWIQTHIEDVSQEDMGRRMAEPQYIESMKVAQETFAEEMAHRS